MKNKILAGVAALAIGLGLTLVVTSPASAHTSGGTYSSVCQTDGTYKVTWTVFADNAPGGSTVTVTALSPASLGSSSGPGNQDQKFEQIIPGNTVQPEAQFSVSWDDGFSLSTPVVLKALQVAGNCEPSSNNDSITFCHATASDSNPYTTNTTSKAVFYQAGHVDHSGDIYPAGSIVKQGQTHSWAAQGDQSLLAYPDCQKPVVTPPPPTNQVCTTNADGGTSTNLNANGWTEYASKPGGSATYVDGGLSLVNVDGNSKVSWAHPAVGGSLSTVGQVAVDYTHTSGVLASGPGLNLFVTFAPGLTGTLVGEPNVYGQDFWLTNGSNAAIVAPQTGGGFGSNRHGTINEWLALYPDATWAPAFAFAYGTGGPAVGTLHSVTIGCATYSFDYTAPVPPKPEDDVTYTEWTEPVVTCDNEVGDEVQITRERTTTPTILVENEWVPDRANAVTVTETDTYTVTEDDIAALNCPTTPPTEPPAPPVDEELPTVPALPNTGEDVSMTLLAGGGVLTLGVLLMLFALRNRKATKRLV